MLLLLAMFGYIAFRLATLFQFTVSESGWQGAEFYFLAAGCLLVVGSFVAGTKVGYRSIMLLFVVPGLLDLRSGAESDGPNRILTAPSWTILFLLWKDFRHGVDVVFGEFDPDQTNAFPADWPHLSFFVFRELAWRFSRRLSGFSCGNPGRPKLSWRGGGTDSTPKPEGEIARGTPRARRKALPAVPDKPIVKLLPARCGMLDNEKLQLAGPIGVIAALACGECGAHALAYWPSSPLLWYLDLEVFRPLQYTFAAAHERLAFGDLAQTLCVVTPLLA
jgi:hypothetical protein